jgi:hypothetical protein
VDRKIFNIKSEPSAEQYRAIVDFCAKRSSKVLLVVREPSELTSTAKGILEALSGGGAELNECSEWPGTTLCSGTAQVWKFALTECSVEVLKHEKRTLFQWLEPDAPEDLCFLRADHSPIFVSISHERDAYFVLDCDERAALSSSVKGLPIKPNLFVR